MEQILYDASQKKAQAELVKAGLRRFLALVWGVICRAGVSLPTLRLKRRRAYAYLKAPSTSHFSLPTSHFLTGIANGLIILALAGLILTFYPVLQAELAYKVKNISRKEPPTARAYFSHLLENPPTNGPAVLGITAPDPAFSIVIPKIEARSKVIANVDSADQVSYDQALKIGVAHAAGSSFPGMGETIWLFAHSTDGPWNVVRYNAVFYLLRKLEPDDLVIIFFAGRRFNYQVFGKKIVEPHDTSFLENQGEELLALQTCWPPGTTLKRLIVLAEPAFQNF